MKYVVVEYYVRFRQKNYYKVYNKVTNRPVLDINFNEVDDAKSLCASFNLGAYALSETKEGEADMAPIVSFEEILEKENDYILDEYNKQHDQVWKLGPN